MTEIGHNGYSFDDIVAENLERGIYWAQRDALIRIIRDPRMSTRHEIVLAELIAMTNAATASCFPGRKWLAEATGYTEGTIATTIKELVAAGYVVPAKKAPPSGGRALMHYAVVKPTLDQLRAAIDAHIFEIRKARAKGKSTSPASEVNSALQHTSVDVNPGLHVNGSEEMLGVKSPLHVNGSASRPDVNSALPTVIKNINQHLSSSKIERPPVLREGCGERGSRTSTTLDLSSPADMVPVAASEPADATRATAKKAKKIATRLPEDWALPKSYGEWAIKHYRLTADEIRREGARMHNWSRSSPNGAKIDWLAAWRNWISGKYADRERDCSLAEAPRPPAAKSGAFERYARLNEEEGLEFRGGGE